MGKNLKGEKLPKGISQRKTGIYRGRFYHKGESYSLEHKNLKQLIEDMDNLKYELRHAMIGKGGGTPLDEWFDIWLNTHKKRRIKESTRVRYHDYYHRYIARDFGRIKLADFTPLMIEGLLQGMADEDYSTKTIRDVYNILHSMFKYARQNRILRFDPCDGVECPITKTRAPRILTVEEQRDVIRHAKNRIHENMIITAFGTGLRFGELIGLTWDDLDFANREISVTKTLVHIRNLDTKKYYFKYQTPKSKNSVRKLPMQESVYKALRKQQFKINELKSKERWVPLGGFDNLVFAGINGQPVQKRSFQASLDWIEKSINKEREKEAAEEETAYEPFVHFSAHACRHAFATRCFEAGIDAKTVQMYLGHFSVAITLDLYTHVTDEKARTEMDKLEKLYENIV